MSDIRNIRPFGSVPPKKIFKVIDGKLKEIKKAYRCINGKLVVVWDVGNEPAPIVSGMRTVWKVENSSHSLHFPGITGVGVNGHIDWGDGTVEECNSGIGMAHNYDNDGEYTVTVDYEITSIVGRAFYGEYEDRDGYWLLEAHLSEGIHTIGQYSFGMCKQLRAITLPSTLETLDAGAFYYTSALETVIIPNSVTSIGNACFWVSGITSIIIPEGITSLTSVFDHCNNLVSVTLPQSLTYIGQYNFNYCTSLKNIEIPSNVGTIAYNAFGNTSDITIRIHKTENSISGKPWSAIRANVLWLG